MRRLLLLLLATVMVAAGCSGDDDSASGSEPPATAAVADVAVAAGGATVAPPPDSAQSSPAPAGPEIPPEPVPSSGCASASGSPASGEIGRVDLVSGQIDHFYLLSVPPTTDPVPLVLDLHGYTEGAEIHAAHTGLSALGAAEGFAVATPHGAGTPPQWGFDPSTADITFFDDLLNDIESSICVDRARVYATGLSNGAMMSSILACRLPQRIAAVAPVAGVRTFDGCPIDNPTPLLAFHGTADTFVAFDGGLGESVALLPDPSGESGSVGDLLVDADTDAADQLTEIEAMTVPETVASWADHNGCEAGPEKTPIESNILHVDYDCPIGGDTQLYIVDGGGHTWPGSQFLADATDLVGETTFEIDANTLIWGFFQQQWLEEPPN